MRLDEILRDRAAQLVETIKQSSVQNIFDTHDMIEEDTNNFDLYAGDVYSQDEISDFIFDLKAFKNSVVNGSISLPHTLDTIDSLLTYLNS